MMIQFHDLLKGNSFPNDPLDEKDRKIIVTGYKYGHEGIGFNKFVQELKPLVSRSTVAFRVKRLCKLGYLERISTSAHSAVKPIRVSFKCFSIISILGQLRRKTDELAQRIKVESSKQQRQHADADSFRKGYGELREDWNSCFGMIGSIAVLYGERAASDLFLPLMMENYTHLASEFFSLLRRNTHDVELMHQIMGEHLSSKGTSLQNIKEQVAEQAKKWNPRNMQ